MSNEMPHHIRVDCWDAECQTSYVYVNSLRLKVACALFLLLFVRLECLGCADRSCLVTSCLQKKDLKEPISIPFMVGACCARLT